tara:strand:- start:1869 stop:4955 length:3087 start_codon:yes stop_codon:yes gene_type:complete
MARITSYPVLSTVSSGDWIPITDTSATGNPLKNVTVGDLQSFIIGGSTLQSVVATGNTYQGSSGPLWTWSDTGLIAASTTLSTTLSERSLRVTNLSNSSYADITPAEITMATSGGNKTTLVPNSSLTSNVSVQLPVSSGTLALITDIPASPWVPVTGGINYPTGRVGVNTSVPTAALHVTGDMEVTDSILCPIFKGALRGTIESNTLAITQSTTDNSTRVATTAFVNNAVSAIPSGLTFQGNWDALNNVPDLSALTPDNGDFWIVSVAGTTNLGGITDWQVGDWAISVVSGGVQTWQKIDNSSVLTGTGTGQKIAKWDGSGASLTLADSLIAESGSNVGIGTVTPSYPLTVITEGTAAGFDINFWSEIEKTGTSTGSAYGAFFSSKGNSSGTLANVVGSRNYAKDDGLGDTDFIVGASHFAIANGGGASAGVYGVSTTAQSIGTATQDINYLIGSNIAAELNNPNASARYLQGAHNTIKLGDGDVTDNAMALILDFDYTGTGVITGDFEYLRIQNDTLPVVSGTSRAINSISVLPSVFAGSLESTGFIKTGGAVTEFLMADGSVSTGSLVGSIPTEQIAFGNAGGDGITSSSSFAFNDTSKQLFVGGTSPFGSAKITEDKLQIESNANLRAALQFRNSSPEIYFKKGSVGTFLQVTTEPTQENFIALPDKSGTVALLDDVVGSVTGTGNVGYVPLWSSTTALTDSAIFQNISNGRIGIGTQTPFAQLETTEDILIADQVYIGTGDGPSQQNLRFGAGTLVSNVTGVFNIAIGQSVLGLATGDQNTAIGALAMLATTTGQKNTGIGAGALYDNQGGNENVAIGPQTLYNNVFGSANVAMGYEALYSNNSNDNVAIGYRAMRASTNNMSNNVAIGSEAGRSGNATFYNNTLIGQQAALNATTANGAVVIGRQTGRIAADGTGNVSNLTRSVIIGAFASPLTNTSLDEIVIGYDAEGLGNNTAVIGSTVTTKTRLHGNVAIGTDTPASSLDVANGDVEVSQIASGIILKSPDGTRYRVTVANGGALTVAAV